MAELKYTDVQRAVREELRIMRDMMTRMSQQFYRLENIENQLLILKRDLDIVRRQVETTSGQVGLLARPAPSVGVDQRLWHQIGNSIHAIDARLLMVQKYLQDVSDYVAIASDKNHEDEQFNSA